MSKLFDKLVAKVLAVIVIVLFVIAFRTMILTDENVSAAFGGLIGLLPFAEVITENVCKILKCQYEIPVVGTASVLKDLIGLAFMSCLQPVIVGLLTAVFLPMPKGTHYTEQEDYMDSLGYRVKALIIAVVSAPLIAFASSMISSGMMNFFSAKFNSTISNLLGILVTALLGAGSIAILAALAKISALRAIGWRVLVTFGGGMLKSFMTNALCIAVYVAFINGVEGQIVKSVLALVIMLMIMDFGMQCLRRAVVRIR